MEHFPVLLPRVLDFLDVKAAGTYVDCTLGESHYAAAILARLTTGRLIAIDRDRAAIEAARQRLESYGEKVTFFHDSYGNLEKLLADCEPVEGIVADLGLSRRQFETPERGFSFQWRGPLDMRMDDQQELTAEHIVNHFDERQLADIIYQYGEERRSRRIARAIVRERPIRDTLHLAEVVKRALPRGPRRRIHPATLTFQSIRIAVNDEIGELERFLQAAPLLLAPAGRMVVVSFHSLEDRPVKQAFRMWARREVLEILTRRIVRPDEKEIAQNPASRSAKLRAAERTKTSWWHLN